MKYLVCKFGDDCFFIDAFCLYDEKGPAIEDAMSISSPEYEPETQTVFEDLPMNKGKIFRVDADCDDELCVAEVFEIAEETKWCVIWHHGFDGVDFSCKQFTDKESALAEMSADIEDDTESFCDAWDDIENKYSGEDTWSIDTGCEYYYWDLYEVKEGK